MVEFFFRIIIIGLSVCSYESAVQISGTASHAVVGENFTITCSGPPDSLLIILENNLTNFPVYVFLGANTDNTCIPSGSYNTDYFYSCANDSVIVTYNTTVPGSFMKEELHNSEWTCRNPQTSEQQSLLLIVKKNTGKKTSSSPTCDDVLIYVVHFILTIFIVTFVAVIFIIMKRADIGSKYVLIVAAVLIDVVLECIVLWGFEYGLDFQTFKTNDACNVVIIGVVCHVVIIVILLVKVVVLIRFTERIQECMGSCCDSTETTVESGPLTNRSNDHATKNGVQQAVTPHANNIAQPVTTRT